MSCPRRHRQAIYAIIGAMVAPSHFGHEAMAVESTYLAGHGRRGKSQSGKLQAQGLPEIDGGHEALAGSRAFRSLSACLDDDLTRQ